LLLPTRQLFKSALPCHGTIMQPVPPCRRARDVCLLRCPPAPTLDLRPYINRGRLPGLRDSGHAYRAADRAKRCAAASGGERGRRRRRRRRRRRHSDAHAARWVAFACRREQRHEDRAEKRRRGCVRLGPADHLAEGSVEVWIGCGDAIWWRDSGWAPGAHPISSDMTGIGLRRLNSQCSQCSVRLAGVGWRKEEENL